MCIGENVKKYLESCGLFHQSYHKENVEKKIESFFILLCKLKSELK